MDAVKQETIALFSKDTPLVLDCKKHLEHVDVYYEQYGQLNEEKSNAILICHALTHGAHAAGDKTTHSPQGWWQYYIGPNKCFDTTKYCVICSNILGSCYGTTGPHSLNPETGQAYGPDFPVITVQDMVRVQKKLMDYLEIPFWNCVAGGSLGALQALTWSIDYPNDVLSCISIAGTSQVSAQAVAFDRVGFEAITKDPAFKQGHYESNQQLNGLAIARMLAHITYSSEDHLSGKFGRKLQDQQDFSYQLKPEFQIESYLSYQAEKFLKRFDANTYLCLKKAIAYFDIPQRYGSLEKAFSESKAKFLIVAISSDWLYKPQQSWDIANVLIQQKLPVSYVEIDSLLGHDGLFAKDSQLEHALQAFLEEKNA